jgi:hypothetical protein
VRAPGRWSSSTADVTPPAGRDASGAAAGFLSGARTAQNGP